MRSSGQTQAFNDAVLLLSELPTYLCLAWLVAVICRVKLTEEKADAFKNSETSMFEGSCIGMFEACYTIPFVEVDHPIHALL